MINGTTYKKKYHIFVSSTYEDLREERNAVNKAICDLGHIPVGMEDFGSRSQSSWKVIEEAINESDYYVVLIGLRYGSRPRKNGLSFTEQEFDYASKFLPILSFIRKADSSELNKLDVDEKAQAALKKFIEKAEKQHQCSYWTDQS
jgi:hypothetical protein